MIAAGTDWFRLAVITVCVVAAFEVGVFMVSELFERRRDRRRRWSRR